MHKALWPILMAYTDHTVVVVDQCDSGPSVKYAERRTDSIVVTAERQSAPIW